MTRPVLGYVLGAFPVLSESFVGNEMRALAQLGVRVEPFAFDLRPDDGHAGAGIFGRACAVASLPDRLPPLHRPRAAARLIGRLPLRRQPSAWRYAARLATAARAAGCTHLHAHFAGGAAVHAVAAARLAGLTMSFTVHSGIFARNFDSPTLIGPMLAEADACVAVSAPLLAELRANGARRTLLLPCGVDLTRFRPRHGGRPNGRMLFVGRLIDCKGADDALAALALLPAASRPGLDIAGDGPERAALERQAAALRLDVRFLGARPNAWFAAEGATYAGLLAPFRRGRDGQEDGSPVVLKEALALGLPMVTTSLPGPAEVVGDSALIVPPGDRGALAAAVQHLMALDPTGHAALSAAARARAGRFGLDAQAACLVALVESLRS